MNSTLTEKPGRGAAVEAPSPLPETLPAKTPATYNGVAFVLRAEAELAARNNTGTKRYWGLWDRADGSSNAPYDLWMPPENIDWSSVPALTNHQPESRGGQAWIPKVGEMCEGKTWLPSGGPRRGKFSHFDNDSDAVLLNEEGSQNVVLRDSLRPAAPKGNLFIGIDPAADAPETVKEMARELDRRNSFKPGQLVIVESPEFPKAHGQEMRFDGYDRRAEMFELTELKDTGDMGPLKWRLPVKTTALKASESVRARFPDSWRSRCWHCHDKLGDGKHEAVIIGTECSYHRLCFDKVTAAEVEKIQAERAASKPQLPTCLCGATIFRAFQLKLMKSVVCAECYIRAGGQTGAPSPEVEPELSHPWESWATPSWESE